MIYLTSDTHFNHEKIIEFCRHDFKTTDEMNWHIVKVWNEFVSPDDTIYHLGDFAFKTGLKKEETRNLFNHLNGKKKLLIGNHDNLKHIKDFGWDSIEKEATLEIQGVIFKLAHFPYPWGRTAKDLAERPECMTQPNEGELIPLLNGHVHETWMLAKGCLNVGWDIFHKPVSVDKVFEIYTATNHFNDPLDFRRDLL